MIKKIALLFAVTTSLYGNSQIEGDNLFANDQVVTIDLTFHQTSYFDSLEANYLTETYMKADLILTDETGTHSFTDIGVRFKGNSTYNHPNDKKSFKIDFNKYDDAINYDGLKKLNFNNNFKDPSMMREKIFFDVCKEANVPAPRANFANVYFNGTLWGFYTMVEQIDDQFLDWAIEEDDGNLFKAGANFGGGPGGGGTAGDLVYYGPLATDYTDRYELKTNEVANDWTDLIDLMDFINNSTDADFNAMFSTRFEREDILRSFALDNLFSSLDSYTGSARNWYIYHNLDTDKWEWIKWDGNETFGSYATGGVNVIDLAINYHDADRPLLERIFGIEDLYISYKNEMCFLLENYFNSTYLDPKIDAYYALIQSSVYADNNKQYTNQNFDDIMDSNISTGGGGPGGGTIYGLKPFISTRFNNVTNDLDCAIYNSLNENEIEATLYPNPTNGIVYLDLNDKSNFNLTVYDNVGNVVLEQKAQSLIDLTSFANGLYFVEIKNNDSSARLTKKIIKD